MAMLEINDLHVNYGMIAALKGISFEVNEGEVISLIGANGAGKTTTLHTLTGLISAKSGSITFNGVELTKTPAHKIVEMGIAHVPEGRRIFQNLTVLDNLKLGAFTRKDKENIPKDIQDIYERFPRLAERKNQIAGTLSGGEQQMLAMGRALMKFLGCPIFSKCARVILDSKFSVPFIFGFAEKNGIDMFDYEERMYRSFNDFFTRKIKPGRRFITKDRGLLVSPCDGKVTAYKITQSDTFIIKNAVYNTASLLRDSKLAKRYEGGYAVIIRLSVDDYHRYCYCADGVKSHDRKINGIIHTVNPVVNNYLPVFKENSREYCMIRTEQFGDIIQMEVGALMVGRITNLHTEGGVKVTKGEEKGYFEFGGSTILLLLEKDKVKLCDDLLKNTREGFETKLLQGSVLGESLK